MRVFHDSRSRIYRGADGAVALGDGVALALDVWDMPDARVLLRTWVDGEGEGLFPMASVEDAVTHEGRSRFQVTYAPQSVGAIWYHFVIESPDGRMWRYGAQPGRTGGVGALTEGGEPDSFQLTVYGAGEMPRAWYGSAAGAVPCAQLDRPLAQGDLESAMNCLFMKALVGYLREEVSAIDLAQAIQALHEQYPLEARVRAFDLLGSHDRIGLALLLSGVESEQLERMYVQRADSVCPQVPVDGSLQSAGDQSGRENAFGCLDERGIGLAKGRLWCAGLIRMLMPAPPNGDADGEADVRAWGAVDGDLGAIVGNCLDLRSTLPQFAQGDYACFAVNDDVFGFWASDDEGSACVLVNRSLSHAYDVAVPFAGQAVSEVIAGYGVPAVASSLVNEEAACAALAVEAGAGGEAMGPAVSLACGASAYMQGASVHLNQLGSAALFFPAQERFAKLLQPGLGVLAHITSLPNGAISEGEDKAAGNPIGDGTAADDSAESSAGTLGAPARAFIDWLADAGIRYWQVLPVNPTDEYGSPYAGISAFAGDPLLIEASDAAVAEKAEAVGNPAFEEFCEHEGAWLEPYACFMAIRKKMGSNKAWQDWPKKYRRFDPELVAADSKLAAYAQVARIEQFEFDRQWRELLAYAHERGVMVIGDMPLYVSADSSDVWAHPEIFQLDKAGRPSCIAGCPPDSFAPEGQLWGNPVYDWRALASGGYDWWLRRLSRAFELYDAVRLDHFIGFMRYYSIPIGEGALAGSYRPGPGIEFFRCACERFGQLPVIAEDLGSITPAVRALVAACGFPGMDIVQFVDGGDPLSYYHPRPDKIVYTGTHDNQTLAGYCAGRYPELDAGEASHRLMERAVTCGAKVVVLPLQDLLGLGDGARMNVPGVAEGNWAWRARGVDVARALPLAAQLARLKDGTSIDGGAFHE